MQYAVGVGAKRSTHTVYLADMGGGDRYLWCKKVIPHAVGYAVHSSSWCKKVNSHSVCSKYGVRYAVCSRCWCKKVNTPHSGHAVHAVGVGAKKSNQCMQYAVE